MSWQDVEGELRTLGDDARARGAEFGRRAERVGNEFVAAEYLTTRGVLEWAWGWNEDVRDGVGIAARQWRHLFDDAIASCDALLRVRTPQDLAAVPGDHLRRRLGHVRDGVDESGALAARSLRRAAEPWRTLVSPFVDLVRRDWRDDEGPR